MRKLVIRSRSAVWLASLLLILVAAGGGWWLMRDRAKSDLITRGNVAYAEGDWSLAAELARTRLKATPDDRAALRLLARATARAGRDSSANALFARLGSVDLEGEDLYLLGLGLRRSGLAEKAERTWERALVVDARHAETLEQLASLYAARNRLAEAALLAERLSRQPGWELRGELMLGSLQAELNDPGGAAKALQQALERPEAARLPNEIAARHRKLLARTLLQTSKPDEARDLLRKLLDRGQDEEASWLLSRAELATGALAAAADALKAAGSYRKRHPLESEPGPFAGETRCAACHSEIFEAQQSSRHSSTLARGMGVAEIPYPDQSITDPDDPKVSHRFRREGGHIRFETRTESTVRQAIVEYAFGSWDHYASLVGTDLQGRPHILRLSHYQSGPDSGWVRTTGHSADASGGRDLLGKPLDLIDGVQRCLFCHSTNPAAVLARSGQESRDRGIGCERCHGPGRLHLKAVAAKFPDRAIVNPKLAGALGRLRLCGQCHSYHAESPLPRTDTFWIRFQGTTLPWSRCYTESDGGLDCMTCHDPHRTSPSKTEDVIAKCLSCHSSSAATKPAAVNSTEHSRAAGRRATCPVNPTGGCIGCHMPPFKSEPLHATFTDHYIRVHREVKDQGRP